MRKKRATVAERLAAPLAPLPGVRVVTSAPVIAFKQAVQGAKKACPALRMKKQHACGKKVSTISKPHSEISDGNSQIPDDNSGISDGNSEICCEKLDTFCEKLGFCCEKCYRILMDDSSLV